MKQKQLSRRAIARQLGRSPSTICRELQGNQMGEGIYLPDNAQLKMQQRGQNAKTAFEQITSERLARVQARLKQYHSLQQITGRLKREGKTTVSHETIYQMVYGLTRQFFPKGTNFEIVKQQQVDQVVDLINHRPGKSLGLRSTCLEHYPV